MAEFKVIETQEQLDEVLKDRLDRAKAKANEQMESYKKEIESLKATIEATEGKFKEQSEKLQSHDDEVAKLTTEINQYKLANIKHRVAHENGLPYELAERLTGETEDALKADAEALKKYVGVKAQVPPLATQETPEEGKPVSSKEQLRSVAQELLKK